MDAIGFNPYKFFLFFTGIFSYFNDYNRFRKQLKESNDFKFVKLFPILGDKSSKSGIMKGHYFHQDLLVARKIFINNPIKHIDIGSRIDGFVAHVAVFREIEIFDIRKQESNVKNIVFKRANLIEMQDGMREYCDSVSSLHAIEHFGLGRYGDPIDVDGHLKAILNICMILKKGGKFYFSVPIGHQRIEFNAHRVFGMAYLLDILEKYFVLNSFSFVDDDGALFENIELTKESVSANFNCEYGCGIFELSKM